MGKRDGSMVKRLRSAIASALIVLSAGFLMMPIPVRSEFYRYVDKDGKIHYVDDIGRIPPEYRDGLKRYRERYDHLTEAEKSARIEEERREAEESGQRIEKEEPQSMKEEEGVSGSKEGMTKVSINGNHVLVPVKLKYGLRETTAMLVLDTGAELTVIHKEIADRLRLRSYRKGAVKVAGGKKVPVTVVKMTSVQVGPNAKSEMDVLVLSPEGKLHYEGLLGMNFLKDLDYRIDFENQIIYWR